MFLQTGYVLGRDLSSMEAFYTFDEGNEEGRAKHAIVVDQTGKNAGTLYGATFEKEAEGFSLALDGQAAFARCARPDKILFGEDNFSVEFWIKVELGKAGIILSKKGENPDSPGWYVGLDDTGQNIQINLADRSLGETVVEAPLPDMENWHYVVVVRQGDTLKTLKIYIDGEELVSESGEDILLNIDNSEVFFNIGRPIGKYRSFSGKLDDVGLWRKELTSEEVKEFYENSKSRKEAGAGLSLISSDSEDRLVLHYRFESDPGGIARDLSGRGNDGSITDGEFLKAQDGESGALRFNGTSSYIDIPTKNKLNLRGDISFELWVRQNGVPPTKGAIIFGEASPGSSFLWGLMYGYNLLLNYSVDDVLGKERVALPVTNKMLGKEWAHVAVVIEYPRCRFYKNGELIRDQFMPLPSPDLKDGKPLRLGGEPINDYYAPVDIREFRLYERALSGEEVAAHARGKDYSGATAQIALEPNWYKNQLQVRYTLRGKKVSNESVTFTLSADGEKIATKDAPLRDVSGNGSGRFSATENFSLEKIKKKAITLTASGPFEPVLQHLTLEKPTWVHGEAGRSDKVPAPWSPVKISRHSEEKLELKVWGRTYEFNDSLFPLQITTAGAPLLAAPVSLPIEIAGKEGEWKRGEIKLVESSDRGVVLEQIWRSGAVKFVINATLEFDGYLQYRCELSSDEKIEIDRLALNFPLRASYAQFCYADRAYPLIDKNYVNTFFSGAIGRDALAFQFSPNVWIGNDNFGLTWQAESDQYWVPVDEEKVLEIIPGENQTVFVANFIARPVEISPDKSRVYEFALLPTPVKPLERDAWSLRIARFEPWGRDLDLPNRKVNGKPELEVIYDAGVRHLFSFITDVFPWPMPLHTEYRKRLKELVVAAHAAGLKIYPYAIHQRVPVNVPEFDIYGTSMANRPMKSFEQAIPYPRNDIRPGAVGVDYGADSSSTVFMCAKSEELRDAYANSLNQRMIEFDEDGVYLDGTVHIGPLCFNEAHGCGYRDESGKLHGTYPTFAIRKFMQRIYEVVKSLKPDGVIDAHSSFGYNPAGLAYADVMWTGEQWHHLRKTGTPYVAEELTLDKFRTEFTGRQVGIGAETLHYRLRHPMKIAASSLLHDISPRYSTGGYDNSSQSTVSFISMIPDLWRMRDAFGAQDAERLFYWENQDYVKVSPEKAYVTLLKHPENGTLAFVSNLSTERREVLVDFQLEKLGLKEGEIQAVNALTGERIPISQDGELKLPLESEQWAYIWLKPLRKGVDEQ
ncbi:MAG: glycoside hydrolase domain-containing protein [Chthoniobacterales bacterium]